MMKSVSLNNYIENFSVKDTLDKIQYTGHSSKQSKDDATPVKNKNKEDYFASLESHYDDNNNNDRRYIFIRHNIIESYYILKRYYS